MPSVESINLMTSTGAQKGQNDIRSKRETFRLIICVIVAKNQIMISTDCNRIKMYYHILEGFERIILSELFQVTSRCE